VLEQSPLARDERFATNSERVKTTDDLHGGSKPFRGLSSQKAIERLDEAMITNARIETVQGFLDHPQLEARDRWREVGSLVGPLRSLLQPVNPNGSSNRPVRRPSRTRG
jgi:crotonobetainyl-CoA:carnitine CoA-transferase CaiB-like acyl-CoA transferase